MGPSPGQVGIHIAGHGCGSKARLNQLVEWGRGHDSAKIYAENHVCGQFTSAFYCGRLIFILFPFLESQQKSPRWKLGVFVLATWKT